MWKGSVLQQDCCLPVRSACVPDQQQQALAAAGYAPLNDGMTFATVKTSISDYRHAPARYMLRCRLTMHKSRITMGCSTSRAAVFLSSLACDSVTCAAVRSMLPATRLKAS
jgi:hypothetical protein